MKPDWYQPSIDLLLQNEDLPQEMMDRAISDLTVGQVDDALASTFLVALRMKGESPEEIAVAVNVLRRTMNRLETNQKTVIDTCGTGGDDAGTFNISTASALVVAACGLSVVKHGNRAVSSKSGSADVLQAFGVPIDAGLSWAQRCFEKYNFAFCFAPHFHPSMSNVATLRKKIGVRTIFNLLGPLSNPALAGIQLIGVGKRDLFEKLQSTVQLLGTQRTVLVHGKDGLDEVTLNHKTIVAIVEKGSRRPELTEWTNETFGLEKTSLKEIQAKTPQESVEIIQRVLQGEKCAARNYVLANAATAIWAASKTEKLTEKLTEGVELAANAIDSGKAWAILQNLIQSQQPEATLS